MRLYRIGLVALALFVAIPCVCAQERIAVVRGSVTDPDGAVVPGASISLMPESGRAIVTESTSNGSFVFSKIAFGTYQVICTMQGFAAYRNTIQVSTSSSPLLVIAMKIEEAIQQVEVRDDTAIVSRDQSTNAASSVIKGRDLESLSDDPDELASELSALSGPPDGPSGIDIYINGFTGGQLPAKSSIREIRINQQPFSAQYDRIGSGRVEIFTKPGTDSFHGSFQVNGNHSVFNSEDPLLNAFLTPNQPRESQPPYYTILGLGSLAGPISHRASISIFGSDREIHENNLVNATVPNVIYSCLANQTSCSYASSVPAPQSRYDVASQLDIQRGKSSTLMVRGAFEANKMGSNGIGNLNLPSTGYQLDTSESTLQSSLTQVWSAHAINEIRAEFQREESTQVASSNAPSLTVQGAFIGGGALTGSSTDHQVHLEFQDYLALDLNRHFLRIGGRLRSTRDANSTNAGMNGAFIYNCLSNVVTTVNTDGNVSTEPCSTNGSGAVSSYDDGQASQFSRTIQNLPIKATVVDLALYAEDEWKIGSKLDLAYGLRFETQNHLADHHDFAPRVALSYGLGKGNSPKTVLRAGAGIFYQRFSSANVMTTVRQNGVNQIQNVISNPSPLCSPSNITSCDTSAGGNTTYGVAPGLRSPYSIIVGVSVDRQLAPGITLSLNANHNHAVHQLYSENINAPQNGVYPNPGTAGSAPPVAYEYVSGATYSQTWYVLNLNAKVGKWLSLYGYTYFNFAKSDTAGASTFPTIPGSIRSDYGRAAWDIRNKNLLGGSSSLPLGLTWSFTVIYWSGNPYNVTLGSDLNKDSIYNERPGFLPGRSEANCRNAADFAVPTAATTYTQIPINYCTGPGSFVTYTRVVKNFGLGSGPKGKASGRGSESGRRYNLSFGVQFQNLFNNVDVATPQGVLASPNFGKSTQLAGQPFTSRDAVRHINLQSSFSF